MESTVEVYPALREMTGAHQAMSGTQLGDPARAASAIITVATRGDAPLHQLLGWDALEFADARLHSLRKQFDAARDLAVTSDHPAV
ncbi:hypothetical protein [Gordonia jinghuaiqii]|uniref:hypothetical protein n=1 Tax=Gordonia jinghuaiqii TaxID=2758710 RepID=UPI002150EF7E|nr:hypothetical protein [Gordonia jinghuaiqii]